MMYNVQYRTYQQICMHSASKGLFTGKQDMYLYSTPKYLYSTPKSADDFMHARCASAACNCTGDTT